MVFTFSHLNKVRSASVFFHFRDDLTESVNKFKPTQDKNYRTKNKNGEILRVALNINNFVLSKKDKSSGNLSEISGKPRDYTVITCAEFSEKLTFLTP